MDHFRARMNLPIGSSTFSIPLTAEMLEENERIARKYNFKSFSLDTPSVVEESSIQEAHSASPSNSQHESQGPVSSNRIQERTTERHVLA